jgi:hypothetical protein
METPDNIVFSQALQSEGLSDASPFVKRDLLYIQDNNGSGNYQSNQIIFDASVLSNNGKLLNWQEAKILIPCVIPVTCKSADVDWQAGSLTSTDFMMALKNCNTSLLHSYSIDFGNSNVVTNTQHINMYHAFKYHTELDAMEEELIGSEINYAKDAGDSWQYRTGANGSTVGQGLINNVNAYPATVRSPASCADSSVTNTGMLKRQEVFRRCFANANLDDGKSAILGAVENTHFRNQNLNYVVNTANYKCYYYTAVIRLKDLQFFSSQDFPKLMRNAYFKLTLNVNQVFFEFAKTATGTLTFAPSTLQLTSGGCNPLMVSASYVSTYTHNGGLPTVIDASTKNFPCGSGCLPIQTFQMSLSVCRPIFTHQKNQVNVTSTIQPHTLSSCRLYVPAYVCKPEKESQLLAVRQRQIKYTDVVPYTIYNVAGSFSSIITSGISRAKRLIVVPVLASELFYGADLGAGFIFSDIQSPFSTSPSTTAPAIINSLQVVIGGVPLYPQPINYSFDSYYTEMTNTSAGGQAVDNLTTGRISMRDYISGMYNYFVVDLKRRASEDESTLVSIQLQGTLVSMKPVHLYCFIEYDKVCVADISTGQRLA